MAAIDSSQIWGKQSMHAFVAGWVRYARTLGWLGMIVALIGISGCSLGNFTGKTATAAPPLTSTVLKAGSWSLPAFPGVQGGAQGQVIFTSSNSLVGYACANEIPPQSSGTPPALTQAMVFSTSDSGINWQAQTAPAGLNCAGSALIADDPISARDIFLLASDLTPGALVTTDPSQQSHLSLWRSQDGAQHWTALALPKPQTLAQGVSLGLNPIHLSLVVTSHLLLLGTATLGVGGIVYASTDGGSQWSGGISSPGNGESFQATAPGAQGTMLALATSQPFTFSSLTPLDVWKSADGRQWVRVGSLPTSSKISGLYAGATLIGSPDGTRLAVILPLVPVVSSGDMPRILRSLDGGATWSVTAVLADPKNKQPYGFSSLVTAGATVVQVTDDGTLWAAPCYKDDLTQGSGLDSEGIWSLDTKATTWGQVAYVPQTGAVDLSYLTISVTLQNQPAIWTAFSGMVTPFASIMVYVVNPGDATPTATTTPAQ